MRITGIVVGSALTLIGAVWVLQGLNSQFAPQSFMTGSRMWLVIGALTLRAVSCSPGGVGRRGEDPLRVFASLRPLQPVC